MTARAFRTCDQSDAVVSAMALTAAREVEVARQAGFIRSAKQEAKQAAKVRKFPLRDKVLRDVAAGDFVSNKARAAAYGVRPDILYDCLRRMHVKGLVERLPDRSVIITRAGWEALEAVE